MPKDESRVQSLLSAFTRKRAAPPTEKVKPKDADTKAAYTPAMRTAAAGVTGAAINLVATSWYNSSVDEQHRISHGQQVISALTVGAQTAGAVGAFTHTEGKPMAARLALTGAAFVAPRAAMKALKAATGKDVTGQGTMDKYVAEQIAAAKTNFGSPPFGGVADSRPYL
jgi:hypothetical protein